MNLFTGMKEDDICELLKFERKMLRARIATLKNDKFIQVRLKMETGMFKHSVTNHCRHFILLFTLYRSVEHRG